MKPRESTRRLDLNKLFQIRLARTNPKTTLMNTLYRNYKDDLYFSIKTIENR